MKRSYNADLFGYEANIYYHVDENNNIKHVHLRGNEIDLMELIHRCMEIDPDLTLRDLLSTMEDAAIYAYKHGIDKEEI